MLVVLLDECGDPDDSEGSSDDAIVMVVCW